MLNRNPRRRQPILVTRLRVALLALLAGCNIGCQGTSDTWLKLTVVDARSGTVTPARVEVLDENGATHIAADALKVAGDCGWLPVHNWIPWAAHWQMRRARQSTIVNPFTGTTQFYLTQPTRMRLPPGRYRLRASKGMEYLVVQREIELPPGASVEVKLALERWIDLPAEGWYSADDHLHIARPGPSVDTLIAQWMAAEDLHVANLLQMGLARSIHITPQYGFGDASVYQDGQTLIASGQENPRTHVLGHAITLGSPTWIDFPESYLQYDQFWRAAKRYGAINGFAHWGIGGADEALALWIPEHLLDFLEVLGFGLPYYKTWYELLNMGVRMTPTAGTDYPCSESLPGRERFYTRVDGPLTYQRWLEAVQRGHTFITNGPVLDLNIAGAGIGDELHLPKPGTVVVTGRVRFDPQRDNVTKLELVGAGEVLFARTVQTRPGEIGFYTEIPVPRSTWFALRAAGEKRGETLVNFVGGLKAALLYVERSTNEAILKRVPNDGAARPSAAHTAPIYVTVAGTPPIAQQPIARRAASAWLARLDELEARLSDEGIKKLAGFPGRGDGLTLKDLQTSRTELLAAITKARAAYHSLQAATPATAPSH